MALRRDWLRDCPNEILGRAAIASRTITRTAFVIGALGGGAIAAELGVRASFIAAGVVQVVALFPMALALRHDHDADPGQARRIS